MNALKGTHVAILTGVVAGFAALTTAPAQGADEYVPQAEIENTYRAQTQGRQLYRAKKYKEAIPYLEFAAQRGFKQSQVRLGEIYVKGLGGVEPDLVQGVGWLGVAASGESAPEIRRLYESVRENIPAQHNDTIEKIVQQYTSNFDGSRTRVVCEMVQRAGTHGKMMRCRYLDETLYPGISRG